MISAYGASLDSPCRHPRCEHQERRSPTESPCLCRSRSPPNQPREELSSNLQPAEHTVLVLKMEVDLAARNHLSHPTELWTKADIILKVIRSGQFDSIVVNFFFFWLSVNIQSHKS